MPKDRRFCSERGQIKSSKNFYLSKGQEVITPLVRKSTSVLSVKTSNDKNLPALRRKDLKSLTYLNNTINENKTPIGIKSCRSSQKQCDKIKMKVKFYVKKDHKSHNAAHTKSAHNLDKKYTKSLEIDSTGLQLKHNSRLRKKYMAGDNNCMQIHIKPKQSQRNAKPGSKSDKHPNASFLNRTFAKTKNIIIEKSKQLSDTSLRQRRKRKSLKLKPTSSFSSVTKYHSFKHRLNQNYRKSQLSNDNSTKTVENTSSRDIRYHKNYELTSVDHEERLGGKFCITSAGNLTNNRSYENVDKVSHDTDNIKKSNSKLISNLSAVFYHDICVTGKTLKLWKNNIKQRPPISIQIGRKQTYNKDDLENDKQGALNKRRQVQSAQSAKLPRDRELIEKDSRKNHTKSKKTLEHLYPEVKTECLKAQWKNTFKNTTDTRKNTPKLNVQPIKKELWKDLLDSSNKAKNQDDISLFQKYILGKERPLIIKDSPDNLPLQKKVTDKKGRSKNKGINIKSERRSSPQTSLPSRTNLSRKFTKVFERITASKNKSMPKVQFTKEEHSSANIKNNIGKQCIMLPKNEVSNKCSTSMNEKNNRSVDPNINNSLNCCGPACKCPCSTHKNKINNTSNEIIDLKEFVTKSSPLVKNHKLSYEKIDRFRPYLVLEKKMIKHNPYSKTDVINSNTSVTNEYAKELHLKHLNKTENYEVAQTNQIPLGNKVSQLSIKSRISTRLRNISNKIGKFTNKYLREYEAGNNEHVNNLNKQQIPALKRSVQKNGAKRSLESRIQIVDELPEQNDVRNQEDKVFRQLSLAESSTTMVKNNITQITPYTKYVKKYNSGTITNPNFNRSEELSRYTRNREILPNTRRNPVDVIRKSKQRTIDEQHLNLSIPHKPTEKSLQTYTKGVSLTISPIKQKYANDKENESLINREFVEIPKPQNIDMNSSGNVNKQDVNLKQKYDSKKSFFSTDRLSKQSKIAMKKQTITKDAASEIRPIIRNNEINITYLPRQNYSEAIIQSQSFWTKSIKALPGANKLFDTFNKEKSKGKHTAFKSKAEKQLKNKNEIAKETETNTDEPSNIVRIPKLMKYQNKMLPAIGGVHTKSMYEINKRKHGSTLTFPKPTISLGSLKRHFLVYNVTSSKADNLRPKNSKGVKWEDICCTKDNCAEKNKLMQQAKTTCTKKNKQRRWINDVGTKLVSFRSTPNKKYTECKRKLKQTKTETSCTNKTTNSKQQCKDSCKFRTSQTRNEEICPKMQTAQAMKSLPCMYTEPDEIIAEIKNLKPKRKRYVLPPGTKFNKIEPLLKMMSPNSVELEIKNNRTELQFITDETRKRPCPCCNQATNEICAPRTDAGKWVLPDCNQLTLKNICDIVKDKFGKGQKNPDSKCDLNNLLSKCQCLRKLMHGKRRDGIHIAKKRSAQSQQIPCKPCTDKQNITKSISECLCKKEEPRAQQTQPQSQLEFNQQAKGDMQLLCPCLNKLRTICQCGKPPTKGGQPVKNKSQNECLCSLRNICECIAGDLGCICKCRESMIKKPKPKPKPKAKAKAKPKPKPKTKKKPKKPKKAKKPKKVKKKAKQKKAKKSKKKKKKKKKTKSKKKKKVRNFLCRRRKKKNFLVHVKFATKRVARYTQLVHCEGGLFIQSRRLRPCLVLYKMCPHAYPHMLNIVTWCKQVLRVSLFTIAFITWIPWLFMLYLLKCIICY